MNMAPQNPCPECQPIEQEGWEAEFDEKYSPKYFFDVGVAAGLQFNPYNEYRDTTVTIASQELLKQKAKEVEIYQKEFIRTLIHQKQIEAGEAVLGAVINEGYVGLRSFEQIAKDMCEAARKAVKEIKKQNDQDEAL